MEIAMMNKQAKLSPHLASPSVAALGNSSELDCTRLSPHFTLGELTKTSAKGLDNTPPHAAVLNLKRICVSWLEPLREEYNRKYGEDSSSLPIIINSGFRSEAVNKAIGGVKGSNHLTGCAVDIRVSGMEQAIRYAAILLDISEERKEDFDELLIEKKNSYWLHFAVRPSGNRRKVRFIQT